MAMGSKMVIGYYMGIGELRCFPTNLQGYHGGCAAYNSSIGSLSLRTKEKVN